MPVRFDAMIAKVRAALTPAGLAEARTRIGPRALPLGRAQGGNSGDTGIILNNRGA